MTALQLFFRNFMQIIVEFAKNMYLGLGRFFRRLMEPGVYDALFPGESFSRSVVFITMIAGVLFLLVSACLYISKEAKKQMAASRRNSKKDGEEADSLETTSKDPNLVTQEGKAQNIYLRALSKFIVPGQLTLLALMLDYIVWCVRDGTALPGGTAEQILAFFCTGILTAAYCGVILCALAAILASIAIGWGHLNMKISAFIKK